MENTKVAKAGDIIVVTENDGTGDYSVGEIVEVKMTRDNQVWGNKYGSTCLYPHEYRITSVEEIEQAELIRLKEKYEKE